MFSTITVSLFSTCVIFTLLLHAPVYGNSFHVKKDKLLSPVILIPGDGGNQIYAKLNKPSTVHYICDQQTDDYFNLWLNPSLFAPIVFDCWVDNMRLVYNKTTRKTQNAPGVETKIPGFGDTYSVEWLDPSNYIPPAVARYYMSAYFVDIVNMLVEKGYERGRSVRGAPFDFRKAPNEMQDYFMTLKDLIEETYEINYQTPVSLICHSMGCPITSYFMSQQPQEWKDKYMKTIISLAGAWGGAVKALKTIASGENLGVLIINQLDIRTEQRSTPGLAYLLPNSRLWAKNETLAMTKQRNYTVENYYEFFRDIKYPTGYEMYKDTHPYAEIGLNPPGVEVYCIHGYGSKTPDILDYRQSEIIPDDAPRLIEGDGDGTVNFRSLNACTRWAGKQKQQVHYFKIKKVEHSEILNNEDAMSYIRAALDI